TLAAGLAELARRAREAQADDEPERAAAKEPPEDVDSGVARDGRHEPRDDEPDGNEKREAHFLGHAGLVAVERAPFPGRAPHENGHAEAREEPERERDREHDLRFDDFAGVEREPDA